MRTKITVCIPSIRPGTIAAAIASVRCQEYDNWELIVVGQGSDRTLARVVAAAADGDSRVSYVHLDINGISRARNTGTAVAGGDVVAFTDDDCEPNRDWLSVLADRFDREPRIGVVGGAVVAPGRTSRAFGRCPAVSPAEALYEPVASGRVPPKGWDWIGANFAVRREIAERVRFDENLGAGARFPAGEDTDFKLRLESMGVCMLTTPRSIVKHTFGYRYGWSAFVAHARNYAMGNGALAGKLTLMGDPRGREWIVNTRRECLVEPIRRLRFHRLPYDIARLRLYVKSYHACLSGYDVDASGLLNPRRSGVGSGSVPG